MDNGFRRDVNRDMQTVDAYGYRTGGGSVIARNAVLRNTYWLLALSMVPTVLGAWLGVTLNLGAMLHGGVGTLIFFVGAFGLMFAIDRNKESGVGVALLLAFTFFMGVMLSSLLSFVLGMANGAALITMAFGGTAIIFTGMATLATVSKRDFSGMGKWLFAGALVLMVASIANVFLHIPAMMLAISVLAIVIFSAFMLFDVQRVVNGGETNYISATLAIYLDLYNVFVNLLAILGIFGGSSRD